MAIEDAIEVIRLESWRKFMELAITKFATASAFVYRGQADSWPVLSSLDRHENDFSKRKNLVGNNPEFSECPPYTEEEHLTAFKRAMLGIPGSPSRSDSDDEWWAFGQHHGLATPLTDWTCSPFIALFFAFEKARLDQDRKAMSCHRIVYALSTVPKDDLHFVSATINTNYRLVSQAALLLKLPRGKDVETHVRELFGCKQCCKCGWPILTKIEIADNENCNTRDRNDCLAALNKMNINRRTLFPDADGAAKYANSRWEPGHEDLWAYLEL